MDDITLGSVLVTLFDLARSDRPATVDRLAARLRLHPDDARGALSELERSGLADAMRVRLTMRGLVLAASFAPAASQPATSSPASAPAEAERETLAA